MISVVALRDESGHTSSQMGVQSRRAPIQGTTPNSHCECLELCLPGHDGLRLNLYLITLKRLGSCGIYANQVKHCLRAGSVGLGRALIFNVLVGIMS